MDCAGAYHAGRMCSRMLLLSITLGCLMIAIMSCSPAMTGYSIGQVLADHGREHCDDYYQGISYVIEIPADWPTGVYRCDRIIFGGMGFEKIEVFIKLIEDDVNPDPVVALGEISGIFTHDIWGLGTVYFPTEFEVLSAETIDHWGHHAVYRELHVPGASGMRYDGYCTVELNEIIVLHPEWPAADDTRQIFAARSTRCKEDTEYANAMRKALESFHVIAQ